MASFEEALSNPREPAVATTEVQNLLTDVTLTATYVPTSIVDVRAARSITLFIAVDAGAANNSVNILPLFSNATDGQGPPLTNDDSWYFGTGWDGTGTTSAALGGTLASGTDWTQDPEFFMATLRPFFIRLENTNNATDEIRMAVTIPCEPFCYFHCQVADVGSATLANLEIKYCLTV